MRGNVTLEEISRSDDEDLKAAIGWWKAYNEYSVGTELENIDLREWFVIIERQKERKY